MKRLLLAAVALCMPASMVVAQSPTTTEALIASGHLDEAARAARSGGRGQQVLLGDVLRMQGRLVAADSVYRAAIAARAPEYRSAGAALAEMAAHRGDRDLAEQVARTVTAGYEQGESAWSGADQVAAGRAYAVLGRWDPQAFHDALRAFDRAVAQDSSNIEAQLRGADLLLDKYNAPDARAGYHAVLTREPGNARALLGLARAAAFEGSASATELARQSLAHDPALVPGWLLLAEQHVEAEAYDSARAAVVHALAVDSSADGAWAIDGAMAWMLGDSARYRSDLAAAQRVQPAATDFYAEIAEAAGRQRRYADAVRIGTQAVAADSTSARAYGVVGENQLRLGHMTEGRAGLERAFALDPYNLWHKNMLDLLDQLQGFKTVHTARFEFVAPPDEAEYLALYLGPLMEEAFDSFATRYQYHPPTPIRVELYGRHADFSVRTVGLTGLGALGVSFGPVLILDSPRSREVGDLNYGSTARHELAHTFTLGLSDNRVPRWISEGLSVLEERRAGLGWGFNVSPDFLAVYKGGALPRASQINEGLVRPRYEQEIGLSYYEASLVCEMVEAEHGIAAVRAMLNGYGAGLDTPAVLQKVFGMSTDRFDQHFDAWMRQRFAAPLAAIDSSDGTHGATGRYVDLVHQGSALLKAGNRDSARALLTRAQAIFPDDGTVDGPAWQLAHLDRDAGDLRAAVAQIHIVTMHSETASDANAAEATMRLAMGDSTGALDALERQQWIDPYDVALHQHLAELSEALGHLPRAVLERRAIVALAPPDPLEARYQLARILLRSGDRAGARREILAVLEQAPAFEKAQALLLDLQGNHT